MYDIRSCGWINISLGRHDKEEKEGKEKKRFDIRFLFITLASFLTFQEHDRLQ